MLMDIDSRSGDVSAVGRIRMLWASRRHGNGWEGSALQASTEGLVEAGGLLEVGDPTPGEMRASRRIASLRFRSACAGCGAS